MNIVHSHLLKDATNLVSDADFLLLALDPASETPTAKVTGPKVTGYLHATNDPEKHVQRSRRPLLVNFDTPRSAMHTLKEAGYTTEFVSNIRSGEKDTIMAYRDTPDGHATRDAFQAALDAQERTASIYAMHQEAIRHRREAIIAATDKKITRRTLAVVYGMTDGQLNTILRDKKKAAMASKRKASKKAAKKS